MGGDNYLLNNQDNQYRSTRFLKNIFLLISVIILIIVMILFNTDSVSSNSTNSISNGISNSVPIINNSNSTFNNSNSPDTISIGTIGENSSFDNTDITDLNNITLYADLSVDIMKDGSVKIFGDTNYGPLSGITTYKLTSKNNNYWLFSLNTENLIFKKYFIEVKLPENAVVTFIKGENINIYVENSRIIVRSYGVNKPITLLIQYKITNKQSLNSNNIIVVFLLLLIIFLIAVIGIKVISFNNENTNLTTVIRNYLGRSLFNNFENSNSYNLMGDTDIDTDKINYTNKTHPIDNINNIRTKAIEQIKGELINHRQEQIFDLLLERKRVNQQKLIKELKIPPSSMSRNINSLVKKGIIKKKRIGMSNILELNEDKIMMVVEELKIKNNF